MRPVGCRALVGMTPPAHGYDVDMPRIDVGGHTTLLGLIGNGIVFLLEWLLGAIAARLGPLLRRIPASVLVSGLQRLLSRLLGLAWARLGPLLARVVGARRGAVRLRRFPADLAPRGARPRARSRRDRHRGHRAVLRGACEQQAGRLQHQGVRGRPCDGIRLDDHRVLEQPRHRERAAERRPAPGCPSSIWRSAPSSTASTVGSRLC
jgi:hypothetical protein